MRIFLRLGIVAASLALGCLTAGAQTIQTNLDYWVQNLNFSLSGSTNGTPTTNGIIARVRSSSVRLGTKDLLKMLYNQPVLALSKGSVTNVLVTTNSVNHNPVYTTNVVVLGQFVFTPVTNASYSASARLVLEQPLTTNAPALIAIRDGKTNVVDYVVTNYFRTALVSFDGRTNAFVTNGKFDLPHQLVSTSDTSIRAFTFDSQGFAPLPVSTNQLPIPLHFEAQGLASEQHFSLIENGAVFAHDIRRNLAASVAGTGQVFSTNAFMVIKGTITSNGGKHESR